MTRETYDRLRRAAESLLESNEQGDHAAGCDLEEALDEIARCWDDLSPGWRDRGAVMDNFVRLEEAYSGHPLIILREEIALLMDEGNGTTAIHLRGSGYVGTVRGKADDVFAAIFTSGDPSIPRPTVTPPGK